MNDSNSTRAGNSDPSDLVNFWRGQVLPRFWVLSSHPYFVFSLLLIISTRVFFSRIPHSKIKVSDISTAGLAFAAISFGACITGLVLILSLSSIKSISKLSRLSVRSKGKVKFSAYSDLIFVFIWAAVSQLISILFSLEGLVFSGDRKFLGVGTTGWQATWQSFDLGVSAYAFFNLYTVLATISQVGVIIDQDTISDSPPQ